MENNQHNRNREQLENSQNIEVFRGGQPGQQLPDNNNPSQVENKNAPDNKNERHSESSLPQNENETLGTP